MGIENVCCVSFRLFSKENLSAENNEEIEGIIEKHLISVIKSIKKLGIITRKGIEKV